MLRDQTGSRDVSFGEELEKAQQNYRLFDEQANTALRAEPKPSLESLLFEIQGLGDRTTAVNLHFHSPYQVYAWTHGEPDTLKNVDITT